MSAGTAARLSLALGRAFAPVRLEIEDESDRHRGHAGAAAGGGHYRVLIVSSAFEGLTALERHRRVYAEVGAMLGREIHALSMRTLTPAEAGD